MSLLVAIEGGDGAGKATAAANVSALVRAAGLTSTVVSFPRYAETVGGHALGEFLSGRMKRTVSPRAAAILYALDRLESRDHLLAAASVNEIVLLDRYVASNIAYQAAKVPESDAAELMDWIVRLEIDMFELPAAALNIYLDTPLETARELMLLKHRRSYTDRQYDEYEDDLALQERVRRNYAALANASRLGPWMIVRTVLDDAIRSPASIAAEIAARVLEMAGGPRSSSVPTA